MKSKLYSTPGIISLAANTITLADSSSTNELQTLSQTAGTISLAMEIQLLYRERVVATKEFQSLYVVSTEIKYF